MYLGDGLGDATLRAGVWWRADSAAASGSDGMGSRNELRADAGPIDDVPLPLRAEARGVGA